MRCEWCGDEEQDGRHDECQTALRLQDEAIEAIERELAAVN